MPPRGTLRWKIDSYLNLSVPESDSETRDLWREMFSLFIEIEFMVVKGDVAHDETIEVEVMVGLVVVKLKTSLNVCTHKKKMKGKSVTPVGSECPISYFQGFGGTSKS